MTKPLDELEDAAKITIPLPELGARLVVEVEREILAFFSEAGRHGLTVTSGEGAGETPTEWFITRITRFTSETAREAISAGEHANDALAEAVIAACSYAVPAYFIGRVLQLEAGDQRYHEMAASYLRRHPVQMARLADPAHIEAVPEIAAKLRAVLADVRAR